MSTDLLARCQKSFGSIQFRSRDVEAVMVVFVGDDWAEAHHDLYVMDEAGERLGSAEVAHGLDGIARFHELVAGHVDDPSQVIVGIEVDRGLWVEALVA